MNVIRLQFAPFLDCGDSRVEIQLSTELLFKMSIITMKYIEMVQEIKYKIK